MTLINSTSTPDAEVLLLYGLSGQYAPLQRYLYYIIIVIALIGKDHWLTVGALASAMVYAGISSVHALVLACLPRRTLLDLDALGTFQITGIALIVTPWLLIWSRTLRHSPSRTVVRWWSVLLMIGTICSTVEFQRTYQSIPPCTEVQGRIVVGQFTGIQLSTSCYETYSVGYSEIRQPNDLVVISSSKISPMIDVLSNLSFVVAAWGSLFCIPGFFGRRESPKEKWLRSLRSTYDHSRTLQESTRVRREALKVHRGEKFFPVVSAVILLTQLIVVERYFLSKHGLPVSEDMSAVGQWGPCVGAVLVVLGAIFNRRSSSKPSTTHVLPMTAASPLPPVIPPNAIEIRVASANVRVTQNRPETLAFAEAAADVSPVPMRIPHPPLAAHIPPPRSPVCSDTIAAYHASLSSSSFSALPDSGGLVEASHPSNISTSSVVHPPLFPACHPDGPSDLRPESLCMSSHGEDNFAVQNSDVSGPSLMQGASTYAPFDSVSSRRASASMTNIHSSVGLEYRPLNRKPASIHDISTFRT